MFRLYLSRWPSLRRLPVLLPLVEPAAQGDPYAGVDARELLRGGLMALSRMQRAVLVLSYLGDLADEGIAVML